jgi:glucokinase
MTHKLIADVGGTNIRLATVTDTGITDIEKYQCGEFVSIQAAIEHYFAEHADKVFSAACIAIAGPVNQEEIRFSNNPWVFSKSELKAALGFKHLLVINDFTAVAHSLPVLKDEQIIQLGSGFPIENGNIAVFGPGTGLGVEHITHTDKGWQTLDGEGGHVDFAPVDETDVVIWSYLQKHHGRASAEEVMSGRGIVNIYKALAEHEGLEPIYNEAAVITESALTGLCPVCEKTLAQFCKIMGSFAGNLAMNLATTGGVFIGGGIAARFTEYLKDSDFRTRFESKGQMSAYIKDVPTYLINEPDHGLLGAAAYLNQHIRSA